MYFNSGVIRLRSGFFKCRIKKSIDLSREAKHKNLCPVGAYFFL